MWIVYICFPAQKQSEGIHRNSNQAVVSIPPSYSAIMSVDVADINAENSVYTSYLAASYVKYIEAAGARVIPVL